MSFSSAANVMRRRAGMQAALYRVRAKNLVAKKSVAVPDLSANAFGSITFPANPTNNATITLGGTVVTFGTTITIGVNLAATLATLVAFLNASADTNIKKCTYTISGSVLTIRSKTPGTPTFTLAASAASISHSPIQLPVIQKRKVL